MTFSDWYVAGCVALTVAMTLAVGWADWKKAVQRNMNAGRGNG